MLDRILVVLSLASLLAFCGVVIIWVAEPDLGIIVLMILALATYDFWISVFRKQQPASLDPGAELEQRYTAVSGKPLDTAKELEADLERSAAPKKARKKPAARKPAAKSRSRSRSKKK